MTTVILVLIAAGVFVLGQRYFARFMALTIFTDAPADEESRLAPWTGAAGHAAAVGGGATVAGAAIAVVWGWSPAYLWMIVGTVIVAGTCVMGARWVSLKAGGRSIAEIAAGVLGLRGAVLFAGISLLFLTVINAVAAVMLGRLLAAQPAVAIALWVQIPLALLLARPLARGGAVAVVATALAVALVLVPVLLAARWAQLELSGGIEAVIGGTTLLRLDPALIWTVVALAYAVFALGRPAVGLSLPRGVIAGGTAAALVVLTVIAVMVARPEINAPEINRQAELPSTLPWLFLVLTGGAAGGLHGLLAAAGRLEPRDPAPPGYGAALAVGALGVAVLAACTAGMGLPDTWHLVYRSWDDVIHPNHMVEVFLAGFAYLGSFLNIPRGFAADLGALVVAGLALATLEAGLRLQHRLLGELLPEGPDPERRGRSVAWTAVALIAAAALIGQHAGSGELIWPLLGASSHLVTAAVIGVVTLAVVRLGRPVAGLMVPLAMVGAALAWGLTAVIVRGWQEGSAVWLAMGAVLLAAEAWLAVEGIMVYRRSAAAARANGRSSPG